MNKETKNKLKYLIRNKKSLLDICEELQLSKEEVIGLVILMKQDGDLVDYVNGELTTIRNVVNSSSETFIRDGNGENLHMLLISDTHLGNKSDRLDILRWIYWYAEEQNIKHILHIGDLTDGYYPNRPQQIYELKVHGFDEQKDYVIEKFPKNNISQTYFITGNHDFTHVRNGGGDLGKAVGKERDDMTYLGADTATIDINGCKVHLFHGSGGKAYSRMYKLQKYAETLTDMKPHILAKGHSHDSGYMKYQGIDCFQVGALVGETQYSRAQGFANEMSCWEVQGSLDKKTGLYDIVPKQHTFSKKLVRIPK